MEPKQPTLSHIDARKKAEEALKQVREESESSKRLFETITANTPDLIYVWDLHYRFTYANQALLNMWGKNWEQAIGCTLLENGYEPWHATMHEREIDHVIATKESVRGVVSFPHATQGKRIYDYILVPVLNDKGEVEAVAGTTRDITEIKKAEEALKRSGEILEAQVAERTEALRRSNEDLQRFAHVASHDLKEPVRKVRTFTSRLKQEFAGDLPEKAQDYVNKIEKAAERMYSMIEGVLLYSSLNAMEQSFEPVALNDTLANIETDLEVVIQQKQATIHYGNLPVLTGSPILLYQLFYNLINNSLKFASTNRPLQIHIDAEVAGQDELQKAGLNMEQPYTKIKVQDNGIGFDQQDADNIFQSFSRLHPKDRYEGTGLGLALCKNIIERHGGAITATGFANEGATFTLLLPLPDDRSSLVQSE